MRNSSEYKISAAILSNSKFQAFALIVVIAIQNLIIFREHYFQDYGFPWDFPQGYYALTAFWTTLVSQGVYPAWVPFHSLGMPFDVILQTGVHYPPLWIFPIFKIEYSLHAAVVFQCLHVLFGAFGMFFFLRSCLPENRYRQFYAFFGAFAFQFFGGFYSNAEHVDIVRAFALTPWLFYFFYLGESINPKIGVRHYFIPGIILFVATGAYPGNVISSLVVASLFCLLQFIWFWWQGSSIKTILRLAGFIFGMTCLGLGLSFFHLAPAWLLKDYLVRSAEAGRFSAMAQLGISSLPTLFLENDVLVGEISMTSTYLTLPALMLLSLVPMRAIKEQWVKTGILIFCVLLVMGKDSVLWFGLTRLVSPMKFSRFPSSDYRIFIAIVLIYFACLGLKALVEREITIRGMFARSVFILFWFSQGIYVSYPVLRSSPVYQAGAVFIATLVCMFLFVIAGQRSRRVLISFVLAGLVLTSLDAFRVLPGLGLTLIGASTWRVPSISTIYDTVGVPLERDGHLLVYDILSTIPGRRPERIQVDNRNNSLDYFQGFLTGKYIYNSFKSPNLLKSAATVQENSIYQKFMLSEWTPLFFEKPESGAKLAIPLASIRTAFKNTGSADLGMVRQVHYGINEIEYNLALEKPLLMVENETYFPGWSATLTNEQGGILRLDAISVNDIFRAWQLPAGNYKMTAHFELPNLWVYNGASLGALLLWLAMVLKLTWSGMKARS